jgi:hypothetical protein
MLCWLCGVTQLLTCSSIWRLCRDIIDLFQYLEVMPWYYWLVPVFGGYAVILLTCSSIWRLCRDIVDLFQYLEVMPWYCWLVVICLYSSIEDDCITHPSCYWRWLYNAPIMLFPCKLIHYYVTHLSCQHHVTSSRWYYVHGCINFK